MKQETRRTVIFSTDQEVLKNLIFWIKLVIRPKSMVIFDLFDNCLPLKALSAESFLLL